VCDRPITHDKVQYDVVDPRANCLSFHLGCHVIWQRERAKRLADDTTRERQQVAVRRVTTESALATALMSSADSSGSWKQLMTSVLFGQRQASQSGSGRELGIGRLLLLLELLHSQES
jgi:hypothetical protein